MTFQEWLESLPKKFWNSLSWHYWEMPQYRRTEYLMSLFLEQREAERKGKK